MSRRSTASPEPTPEDTSPRVELVPLEKLIQDTDNANMGTVRGDYMLETSISRTGLGRGVVASKGRRLIGGNKTAEKAVQLGFKEAVLVHTRGDQLVVTVRDDVDDGSPQALEMGLWDNRAAQENIAFDEATILGMQSNYSVPIELMWHQPEIEAMQTRLAEALGDMQIDGPAEGEDEETESEEDKPDAPERMSRSDVPDAIWPCDNMYGIPLLDPAMQADVIDSPAVIWGSQRRTARMRGTWLFYTEDYRYTNLWNDPTPVINSGCVSAVEPNYSCYQDMPLAVALYRIYQKRWLARLWQSKGIRVLVDLNVAETFYEHNLLGVPKGWKAWCTRGYTDRMENTIREFELAAEHAGTSQGLTFVVYGGGRKVKELCGQRGWVHIGEDMDRAKDGSKERTDR